MIGSAAAPQEAVAWRATFVLIDWIEGDATAAVADNSATQASGARPMMPPLAMNAKPLPARMIDDLVITCPPSGNRHI
jgi:hypothetical protein